MRQAAFRMVTLALAAAPIAACASHNPEPPAWFNHRAEELNRQGSPALRGIPRGTDATTNPAHWAEVESRMNAAEAALRANPRSAPLPPGGAAGEAFDAQARQDLEKTQSQY